MYDFSRKFKHLEQIGVLGLGFSEKTPVWSKQILATCGTRFPFFNEFQIWHPGSNTIKDSSKIIIKDIIK